MDVRWTFGVYWDDELGNIDWSRVNNSLTYIYEIREVNQDSSGIHKIYYLSRFHIDFSPLAVMYIVSLVWKFGYS